MSCRAIYRASVRTIIALAFAIGAVTPIFPPPAEPTPITPSYIQPAMATKPPAEPVEEASVTAVVATPELTPVPTVKPTQHIAQAATTAPPSGSWQDWFRAAGLPESDWDAAYFIMMKESGGRPTAVNKSSGSCGLFQQLPCGKWAHQWDDPVGAVIDASGYARSRYGGWSQAQIFWVSKHWW